MITVGALRDDAGILTASGTGGAGQAGDQGSTATELARSTAPAAFSRSVAGAACGSRPEVQMRPS